jgi:hypothetical protein
MVKRGTVWVPTIDHNRYYVDARDEYGFNPEAIPPLQDYIQRNLESDAPRGEGRRAPRHGLRRCVILCSARTRAKLGWLGEGRY